MSRMAPRFVPGRLEVFGKHTDYAGGHSLVAALPCGITVSAETTGDDGVTVFDTVSGETATFDARGAGDASGWRRYPATVIRRLASNFPGARLGARISFASTLPQASGMSSSSALVIAVAEALVACADLEDHEAWRAAIATPSDRASYFSCIENGATFKQLAGDAGVGTHGGSEDHAAIVMGRPGHLHLFGFRPLRHLRAIPIPEGWMFAIALSGVRAEKTAGAREAFNRLADPAAMTGARLRHFEAEDARVLAAADAFARGDLGRIAELASASERDADALLGNQVPETRALVARALEGGAAAASNFGAGWGGSVWALVETAKLDALAKIFPVRMTLP